ncbi:unnamed protein product [Lampetra fluviatilis]
MVVPALSTLILGHTTASTANHDTAYHVAPSSPRARSCQVLQHRREKQQDWQAKASVVKHANTSLSPATLSQGSS